jgi:hypothetical protein
MGRFESDDDGPVEAMIGMWAFAYPYGIDEYVEDMGWWLEADGVSRDERTAVG